MPTHSDSKFDRRSFVGVAGIAAVGALSTTMPLAAAELTAAEKANLDLVTAFCASWSTRDMGRIAPFLAGGAAEASLHPISCYAASGACALEVARCAFFPGQLGARQSSPPLPAIAGLPY